MIPTKIKYYGKDEWVLSSLKSIEQKYKIPYEHFSSPKSKITFYYHGIGESGYHGSESVKTSLEFIINEVIPNGIRLKGL